MYQRNRSPSDQSEEDMRLKSKLQLSKVTDPLEKLRLLCLSRGSAGILSFGRVFRRMDDDGSGSLNKEEFAKGIDETGLDLNEEETEKLFKEFDKDGLGTIGYEEFITAIRPPMNESRLKLVELAFDKLDKTDDGIVTLKDLDGVYSVERHPQYLSGELSADEILAGYLRKFENNTSVDGKVTKDEFFDYYSGVSASIDLDAYFDLMMRNAWGIK